LTFALLQAGLAPRYGAKRDRAFPGVGPWRTALQGLRGCHWPECLEFPSSGRNFAPGNHRAVTH